MAKRKSRGVIPFELLQSLFRSLDLALEVLADPWEVLDFGAQSDDAPVVRTPNCG